MADFSSVTILAGDVYRGVMTFIIYTGPLFLVAVLLLIGFFVLKRRKVFSIDCIIYTLSDNNLIQGRDNGGIVKNLLGLEEFRFKKRKKGCPIPNRKHWIMQDNGRFCIHFYRHSEDDFEPCEAKPAYMETPVPKQKVGVLSKIKGLVKGDMGEVPADTTIHDVDIKKNFAGISFTPIKSDSKQYLDMKTKETIYKFKVQKKFDQWKPVIMYGSLVIGFIILVIWGFSYGEHVMDKQVNCISPDVCKEVAREVYGVAPKQPVEEEKGFKTPFG